MDFGCFKTHTGNGLPFEPCVYPPDVLQDFDDAFDHVPFGFDRKALSSPAVDFQIGIPVEAFQSMASPSSGYPQRSLSGCTGPDLSVEPLMVLSVEPLMAFGPPDELSFVTGDNKSCTPVKKGTGAKIRK